MPILYLFVFYCISGLVAVHLDYYREGVGNLPHTVNGIIYCGPCWQFIAQNKAQHNVKTKLRDKQTSSESLILDDWQSSKNQMEDLMQLWLIRFSVVR